MNKSKRQKRRSCTIVVKSKNKKIKERSIGSVIVNTDNKRPANESTKNTNPIQFIIDGLGKNFNNIEIIKNEIKRCNKPNLEILEIKMLKQGGIRVTVPDTHNLNIAVQEWPFDSLGGNSFITLPNDMRETICINKYSLEKEPSEIACLKCSLMCNVQQQYLQWYLAVINILNSLEGRNI